MAQHLRDAVDLRDAALGPWLRVAGRKVTGTQGLPWLGGTHCLDNLGSSQSIDKGFC